MDGHGALPQGGVPARPTQADSPAEPRSRKGNREKILTAATEVFRARGYFPVSIEDIGLAADLSRMTVYRHFAGKAAIAGELFERAADATMPVYLGIAERDFREYCSVRDWIVHIFATDRANRQLLRVFTQANADEATFTPRARDFVGEVVIGLGRKIPAFAINREQPEEQRRWLEAWLLVYELLDQSNRAAWDRALANEPLMIDILASRFVDFVKD